MSTPLALRPNSVVSMQKGIIITYLMLYQVHEARKNKINQKFVSGKINTVKLKLVKVNPSGFHNKNK